jgi:hypothetical protein
MRLDNARRDADGMALVHLIVVGLQCQLLGLAVPIGDGALSRGLIGKRMNSSILAGAVALAVLLIRIGQDSAKFWLDPNQKSSDSDPDTVLK